MKKSCPECGFPLQGNEKNCPECGFPLQCEKAKKAVPTRDEYIKNFQTSPQPLKQQTINEATAKTVDYPVEKTDWANYIYECGVIIWNVFRHKFANTHGRASRREYWSFTLITMCIMPFGLFIILLIPWICVSIRRMHDINRCGWWSCGPLACFFMYLKKSDEGENIYGLPNPAQNMIY